MIYIFAANIPEARHYAQEKHIKFDQWKYVATVDALRGCERGSELIIMQDAKYKSIYPSIMSLARFRLMRIVYV